MSRPTYMENVSRADILLKQYAGRAASRGSKLPCSILASNEPSGCEADIWRVLRGSHTPLLCSVASLMPTHQRCVLLCSGVVD